MDLTGLKSDLTMLDTFAGIGGFSYAASKLVGNIKTTQFIEIDPFCQKILKKHFPSTPIHDDIRTFTARPFQYDVITGGFPCQDISVAGRREGITEESRSGLFYELMRVIRMVRPKFIVLENVAAILNNGLDIVLGELSEAGYDAEWSIISASSLGACHRRSRWWLVAYPNNDGQQGRKFETRNQNATGQDTQIKWSTNSENFERQSNDGDDKRKSRVNENLSRSSNGREAKSTDTRRICELSEGTNNYQGINSQDNYQENNDRTLVSERQSGLQLSECRELARDKTAFKNDSIRQRDDNDPNKGVDNQKSNVANSNNYGLSSSSINEVDDETDSSSQEGSYQVSQSSRSSESSDSRAIQSSTNITDTNSEGLQGQNFDKMEREIWAKGNTRRLNPNWRQYVSKPILPRGSDGLSNRVDRTKALGNSVVPQVAAIPLQRVHDLYYNE